MKTEVSRNLRISGILSIVTILLGIILLVFMITVEDEPGALPLFLILAGTIWFIYYRYQVRKQR